MSRYVVLFPLVATLCMPTLAQAQGPRFGIAIGKSFVGGGDSRVLVDAGGFNVTGSGQAGVHFRGFAEWPLNSTAFAFRAEIFYNRLHSNPNTYAVVGSSTATSALSDVTVGLTGSFVASLRPEARVSPYFLFGAGVFSSMLGTNPDPQSRDVVISRGGMGLGLQTGMGVRFRLQRRDFLVEWRYGQALNNTRGVAFMPLTVGIVF
jgi:hypothetical protein